MGTRVPSLFSSHPASLVPRFISVGERIANGPQMKSLSFAEHRSPHRPVVPWRTCGTHPQPPSAFQAGGESLTGMRGDSPTLRTSNVQALPHENSCCVGRSPSPVLPVPIRAHVGDHPDPEYMGDTGKQQMADVTMVDEIPLTGMIEQHCRHALHRIRFHNPVLTSARFSATFPAFYGVGDSADRSRSDRVSWAKH